MHTDLTKAHESRMAIEKLYIEMRHVFLSGAYRPSGFSGRGIKEALLTLSPEIYGSMNDMEKVELDGLVYVADRLPKGIEECRFIKFTSNEGYGLSNFERIIPPKRVRNCYRIDKEQMVMEVTRGRSEIYDVLTHLTFLFNEAEKIRRRAFDEKGNPLREWEKLEEIINGKIEITEQNRDKAFTYMSTLLGRTFEETKEAYYRFAENPKDNNGLFNIVYGLGKLSHQESSQQKMREITFTPTLRERVGRHIYGESWAENIKKALIEQKLHQRPIHIISANTHSFLNSLLAKAALENDFSPQATLFEIAMEVRKPTSITQNKKIFQFAKENGVIFLADNTGTNLSVQIFDVDKLPLDKLPQEIKYNAEKIKKEKPVIIVMDYAFGEQAYETIDELLKPLKIEEKEVLMPVKSISVMGKAGILQGDKGDLMIPSSHVFEGTADNYPFKNDLSKEDFKDSDLDAFEGTMITVLGTSLQNKDILEYFQHSSWQAIGLEMEGAHYQKAIQAAAKIRKNLSEKVIVRYAYYASDNPLLTGSTLASGSLGLIGVKPTYLISSVILSKIFQ
ncbi:MAG: hypothetical protein EAZ44_10090 [Cytophagia bacterium]|nr:MAG: hypothetical protein EAY69_05310 [Cytophagales bacterium]TAF99614.1 MAG: hypothetical protein EAZ44_10090 [Cytophagia bacterium]TAG40948.1 MAG: hypothetical protein EAZ31_07960 [Cytophagia bacterium]TAH27919.1 MAG: hypothetical protein EAZ06_11995 [Cytophagales bacterium]